MNIFNSKDLKVYGIVIKLFLCVCFPCCWVGKICRSFLCMLPVSLFVVISTTTAFGVIPMLITTLHSSQQSAREAANFQFDTLKTFLDVKLNLIQMNTDILVQDWNCGRVTLSDLSILQHEKLYTHITSFGNTFCSYIFGDYGGHDSQYFGYDFVLTESGEKNYRYWEQWKGSTSLDVWNTFPNGSANYDSLSKAVSNFDVRIRPYFQPNRTEGYFGAPYASASGHIQIYYAKPFQDQNDKTKNVGIVKNNLSLQIITQYLMSVFKSSFSVIIEGNGYVVGTSDTDIIPFQIDKYEDTDNQRVSILNKKIIKDDYINEIIIRMFDLDPDRNIEEEPPGNDEFLLEEKIVGSNHVYYVTANPYSYTEMGGNVKWTVLQFESTSEIFMTVYITFPLMIGSGGLVILLSSLCGCCMIHNLVLKPIGLLKSQMKDVERLRLDGLKTRCRLWYPTTWKPNIFCCCFFIPTEVVTLQGKFYHLTNRLKEYRMFLPAHIKEQEEAFSKGLSREEKKMMDEQMGLNSELSTSESSSLDSSSIYTPRSGDSLDHDEEEEGIVRTSGSSSEQTDYSDLQVSHVNSNSSSMSDFSSFRGSLVYYSYPLDSKTSNKTNITLQTRCMAIVVVQFLVLNDEDDQDPTNTVGFRKNFSSRPGDQFLEAYDRFLSIVEEVCSKHKGQILHFDEDYVTIGFNTSIHETLRTSYNFKALEFSVALQKDLLAIRAFFRIGFSSAKVDSMITFGTKNSRTRRAGKVYLLAKKLCELGGVGQIITDLENLGNMIPKKYIFQPHKVVLLNFSGCGDDFFLTRNSVVHTVMFECVNDVGKAWTDMKKSSDDWCDMEILYALIEGRGEYIHRILKVRTRGVPDEEDYVKKRNEYDNTSQYYVNPAKKREKNGAAESLISYGGKNKLLEKIVRNINMQRNADYTHRYGTLINEKVGSIKQGLANVENLVAFKMNGMDHIELF